MIQLNKPSILLTLDEVNNLSLEDKINLLPNVNFEEDPNEVQQIIQSPLFQSIFQYYQENYSNDLLRSKPLIEQQVGTYLYITGQDENQQSKIENMLYWRYCPTIDEFINNDQYLGKLFKNTLYPYWKRAFNEIYSPESCINKVILAGSTGSGKSTAARIGLLYAMYRILCLRNPQSVLGITQEAALSAFIISVNLKLAEKTNFDPFLAILDNAPCFKRTRQIDDFYTFGPSDPIPFMVSRSDLTIKFPNNLNFLIGSEASHLVSHNVVCFPGTQQILTNKGYLSLIEAETYLQTNQDLYTFSKDQNANIIPVKVNKVWKTKETVNLTRLWIDDENYIECTPEHKFLIHNPNLNDPHIINENGLYYKEAQYLTDEDDVEECNLSYVYALINPKTGDPFYIGIGHTAHDEFEGNLKKQYPRPFEHNITLTYEQHLNLTQKLYMKDYTIRNLLKENFTIPVHILFNHLTWKEAQNKEQELIQFYGRRNIEDYGILSNRASGGEGMSSQDASRYLRNRSKELKSQVARKSITTRWKRNPDLMKQISCNNIKAAHQANIGTHKSEEVRLKISLTNKHTKYKQKQEKLQQFNDLYENLDNLLCWLLAISFYQLQLIMQQQKHLNYSNSVKARSKQYWDTVTNNLIKLNKSKEHREMVKLSNHLHPRISSPESKRKLGLSIKAAYAKKTPEDKKLIGDNKCFASSIKVIKRIQGTSINQNIYNAVRSKGLKGKQEPKWNSLIKRFPLEILLEKIKTVIGKEFKYEI